MVDGNPLPGAEPPALAGKSTVHVRVRSGTGPVLYGRAGGVAIFLPVAMIDQTLPRCGRSRSVTIRPKAATQPTFWEACSSLWPFLALAEL